MYKSYIICICTSDVYDIKIFIKNIIKSKGTELELSNLLISAA